MQQKDLSEGKRARMGRKPSPFAGGEMACALVRRKLAPDVEAAPTNGVQGSGFIHFSTYPHQPVDKSVDKGLAMGREGPPSRLVHDFGENMTRC